MSTILLSLAEAPITAHEGYVCLDIATFVMDNSHSKKEGVSRTYQNVDGYTPTAAYLGNEGRCLGLELRPGKQHTMKGSNAFLERVLPRAQGLTEQPILLREDSGFDSKAHLALIEQHRQAFAEDGRQLDYLVKWNPRDSAKADLASGGGELLARAAPRQTPNTVGAERLAQPAYNILRLMGQLGMTGELSSVRHPAKRRRIRTVLQELAHRAALGIHKARQIILDIGRMMVLKALRTRLRYPRRPPC